MFSIGLLLLFAGYTLVYSGVSNLLNGGQGPTLAEAFGLSGSVAPPSAGQLGSPASGTGPTSGLPGQTSQPTPHGKGF